MGQDRRSTSSTQILLRRIRALARRLTSQLLWRLDRLRYRAWQGLRRSSTARTSTKPPTTLIATIPHWRDPDSAIERSRYLLTIVDALTRLDVECIHIVVISNRASETAEALRNGLAPTGIGVREATLRQPLPPGDAPGIDIVVCQWNKSFRRRHGYLLTWSHVPVLRAAWRLGRYSHLMYLEDDILFTSDHLHYWCRSREILRPIGLLPGFVRFERENGDEFVVDQKKPVDVMSTMIRRTRGQHASAFVNMPNPYQAMYILDTELADYHFRFSPSRSLLLSNVRCWRVRERAATGPIFDHVPEGLLSRNVVPVCEVGNGAILLDRSCLIEHIAGNYVADQTSPASTISVDKIFQ